MPIPGPTPQPEEWVDPRVLAKADVAVRKGTYADRVAFLNHALCAYYKLKPPPA